MNRPQGPLTPEDAQKRRDAALRCAAALGRGEMVLIAEDERADGGIYAVYAAEKADADAVNRLAKDARGIVCVALPAERMDALRLRPMPRRGKGEAAPRFGVTIEARKGVTTGISASDRSHTIRAAIAPELRAEDLVSPGHVVPVRVERSGVLGRRGAAEAALDLVRQAGLLPGAALCQVLEGVGAPGPERLGAIATELGVEAARVSDVAVLRWSTERLVRVVREAELATRHGPFRVMVFEGIYDGDHHVALVKGVIGPDCVPLVRVHSQCLTGDVLASHRCDCGDQLHAAIELVSHEPCGVVVYLRQEGRGIGLVNKIRAYALQDEGQDTVEANLTLGFAPDLRDYNVAGQILAEIGAKRVRLLTNNPRKINGLKSMGVNVEDRIPLEIAPKPDNLAYLRAKREKLGHLLRPV